jgi:hypothetical protein
MSRLALASAIALSLAVAGPVLAQSTGGISTPPGDVPGAGATNGATNMPGAAATSSDSGAASTGASSASLGTGNTEKGDFSPTATKASPEGSSGANPNNPSGAPATAPAPSTP